MAAVAWATDLYIAFHGVPSLRYLQYYLRTQKYHSWAYTKKMLQHVIGHVLNYVHSSHIYNSQKLQRTQLSFNRAMDTENVVHLQNGVLLSY